MASSQTAHEPDSGHGTTREIAFVYGQGSPPEPLRVGNALAEAVARAVMVNQGKDPFLVSFTSLFVGLLASPDPVGEWLQAQFAAQGARLEVLLGRRSLDVESLEELRSAPAPVDAPVLCSTSAAAALREASRLARALGTVADTRHVVAAYISLPQYHDQDFRALGIDRLAWAESFAAAMADHFPQEQRFWRSFVARVFPHVGDRPATQALDLGATGLEPHVAQALRVAQSLAGAQAIAPHHVVRAVVQMAASTRSVAFAQLVSLTGLQPDRAESSTAEGSDASAVLQPDAALARQLRWAQQPETKGNRPRGLWGRDLITAALLCDDPELVALLESAGQPLSEVRERWYHFLTASDDARPRTSWREWWLAAGIPLPGPRRTGIATETDIGDDKLGIEAEARGFARLILDKEVKPPLSIGLLGDWGSGKSFFIEQIRKQIDTLQCEKRPELCGNVVQIEFNAWHASDANLWASLVTYIFDEIWERVSPDRAKQTPEVARQQLLQKIEEARGAVHEAEAQVELARAGLAKAEKDLEKKRRELAWKKHVTSITTEKLTELARSAGFHQTLDTINQVDETVKSLAVSGNRLRLMGAALLERPLLRIGLPAAALATVAGLAWLTFDRWATNSWMAAAARWLAAVAGGVGAVVAPLKSASNKVTGLADQLRKIRDQYDDAIAEVAKKDPKSAAQLVTARRELDSAEASVHAAKARLAELLNAQATMDPRRRLGAFLQERVQSTLYRSQQGIISLVHKDFRQLSRYMEDLRTSPAKDQETGEGIKPFDRIVLYVDDLDRCRPVHVVQMLEAVHLLLALDLFVVVVAVDSRWLTRALDVHYRELIGSDEGRESDGLRASTPQNYLEKIFQITYALGPMDPAHFARYVAFLAGAEPPTTPAPADANARQTAGVEDTSAGRATGAASSRADGAPDRRPLPSSSDPRRPSEREAGTGGTRTPLPPPQPVHIDKDEQLWICHLVPLLSTPRIAKRLVNVYRLIKAGKNAAELAEFQRTRRPRSCLLMLAILFGRPAVASELIRALHEGVNPFDDPTSSLLERVQAHATTHHDPRLREEWLNLARTLDQLAVTAIVGDCAREPIEIGRYSLVSGNDWHTWTRDSRAP